MDNKKLKEELFEHCRDFINSRIFRIKSNIDATQEALTSETKSSAGDKHETGRAMIQLEREKLGQQLAEAEKTKQVLSQIKIKDKAEHVLQGSLVYTTKANYFIGISAGEYKNIYCISSITPIGRLLLGKSIGDTVRFSENDFVIKQIH
ncbi:transcription elongation GreA/GreB family factor [Saonia flava]|uniref:Transcription elongation GreA/GreB family factor n=1 Tax=Saonia flava TaxID=523696 RepID=A0A846R3L3_9FLAO|nr:GreA/GreB family elongation factor [Saonia flava]NJB71409.1 transcription elongation GreA/GreB family factor [Saonia flava]